MEDSFVSHVYDLWTTSEKNKDGENVGTIAATLSQEEKRKKILAEDLFYASDPEDEEPCVHSR